MTFRRYQPSLNRQQEMLLPPCVDEYVSENNTVRAIDAYVNTLDLQDSGFKYCEVMITSGQLMKKTIIILVLKVTNYNRVKIFKKKTVRRCFVTEVKLQIAETVPYGNTV